MSEIMIEWKSMSPSEETRKRVEDLLEPLKYLIPPDSDIRLSLEKFNKLYEGHVIVRSPMGDFAAHSEGRDIFILCNVLKKNLKQQIFKFRDTHGAWQRVA